MSELVKVSVLVEKNQERLEEAFDEAGIIRVASATPPYFLAVSDHVELLTTIAALFRGKPRVFPAVEEDVPEAADSEDDTDQVVELVHRLGYTFNWDDDTQLWCVSGLRDGFTDETPDAEAGDRRAAAFEALRYLAS